MQEVGLITRRVAALVKFRAVANVELRVVTRCKTAGSKPSRMREADAELDLAVAKHVGIGSAPSLVLRKKVRENPVAVLARKVHPVQGYAKHASDRARILEVLGGRAVAVVVFPVRHEEPVHLASALDQTQRRDGGIHSTGESHNDTGGSLVHAPIVRGASRPCVSRP